MLWNMMQSNINSLYNAHCALEEYTRTPRTLGISTESVKEEKVWGFLFYQAQRAERKQDGILKAIKQEYSQAILIHKTVPHY